MPFVFTSTWLGVRVRVRVRVRARGRVSAQQLRGGLELGDLGDGSVPVRPLRKRDVTWL